MSQENFNPLAESRARADVGRQVFEQFMERDSVAQGVEEHAEGFAKFAKYLESRPYEDDKGKLHDPITGKFISKEDAELLYAPNMNSVGDVTKGHEEEDVYASMSLSQLAMLSAEAEVHDDKTTMSSVDDVILDKIEAVGLEDEYVENDGTIRDKSELDNYYDRVMKLRDSYVASLTPKAVEAEKELPAPVVINEEKSSIPAPRSVKEALENTTVEQAKFLNDAWDKQTGQSEDSVEEIANPIVIPSEEINDLPPIIVNDDEILAGEEAAVPVAVETQEKKKWSLKRKVLGAIAVAGIVGASVFGLSKLGGDNDSAANNEASATTEVPDSGIDIAGAAEGIDNEEAPVETAPETTEAPAETDASSTNSEEVQQEVVSAVVANYTPEQRTAMSGDAGNVVVAGDVMPSTNVVSAGVANQQATMQAALDSYNLVHSTNFQFGEGDMFWNGDHVINPAELTEYNAILKQLIEEASK